MMVTENKNDKTETAQEKIEDIEEAKKEGEDEAQKISEEKGKEEEVKEETNEDKSEEGKTEEENTDKKDETKDDENQKEEEGDKKDDTGEEGVASGESEEKIEEKKEKKKELPKTDHYLSFLDFNPELLGKDSQSGIIVFERFDLVLQKANKWLKRHPEYKLKKVQSIDVPVPYTSVNLNPNTASPDFYIDHGSRFYNRTLRIWLLPRIGDEPKEVQQIGYFNIIPETKQFTSQEDPIIEEPENLTEVVTGNAHEDEGQHDMEDQAEKTEQEEARPETGVEYNDEEKKLIQDIQKTEDNDGKGKDEEKKEGNEDDAKGQSEEKKEDDKKEGDENEEKKDDNDDSEKDQTNDNDDKDSGIEEESTKNNDEQKSLKDMNDSEVVGVFNKNKENIRRTSEVTTILQDEYENLEEALERFNSVLLEQPIEGTVLSIETLQTTGKNDRSLLEVDSGIIQKTGRVTSLQFIRVWFIEDSEPITNLGMKDFTPNKDSSDFSSVFKKVSTWISSRLYINVLSIQSVVVPTNSEPKKMSSMDTYEAILGEKEKNVTVIRVFYTNKTVDQHDDVPSKPAVVSYSSFLPVQLTKGRYPRHEELHKLMETVRIWLKATGAEVICAETPAVYMAGKALKVKDTEVTSGPSNSVLVSDRSLHHFVYFVRLYLLGTFKEPKKKELEAEKAGNSSKNEKQSSDGKTKKPQENQQSSTCVIL